MTTELAEARSRTGTDGGWRRRSCSDPVAWASAPARPRGPALFVTVFGMKGNSQRETRPSTRAGVGGEVASVRGRDAFREIEAESESGRTSTRGKALEYPRQDLRRNSRAFVLDLEETEGPTRLILLSHHDMDGGFGRRVLDRVSQHVLEALPQPLGIREHDHFVRGLHLDLMRRSAERACHLLRNASQVHRPEVDPEQPLVDPGDVEEIADHALDSIEVSESGLGVLAVARRVCPVPAADQLESHGDRRDQAAKVVGKDRHQLLGNGAPALLDGGA